MTTTTVDKKVPASTTKKCSETLQLRFYVNEHQCVDFNIYIFLPKLNNNHNPNYKTTKTLVGLGLSKYLETTINPPNTQHHHTNSKLYERVRIELY